MIGGGARESNQGRALLGARNVRGPDVASGRLAGLELKKAPGAAVDRSLLLGEVTIRVHRDRPAPEGHGRHVGL